MTKEEHNKYLAYSHLAYAGFQILFMLLMMVFIYIIMSAAAASDPRGDFPAVFISAVLIITFFIQLLFAAPSLIAGFGLLKRKHWAKTATIVAGVFSAMSFPIGTAVCVYTFWFLFGENGKELYERPQAEAGARADYYLNEPLEDANSIGRWGAERKREYVPPKEMPNWRE